MASISEAVRLKSDGKRAPKRTIAACVYLLIKVTASLFL